MRYSITRIGLFLLIGILMTGLGLVGCGKSGDDSQDQNSTQTHALVPGTVGQDAAAAPEEAPATEPALAQDELNEAAGMAQAARDQARQAEGEAAGASSSEREVPNHQSAPSPQTPPPPPAEKVARELDNQPAKTPPPPPPAPGKGRFSLQLGSYKVASLAEEKANELRAKGQPATVEPADVNGQLYYRVFIRGLADRASAEKLGDKLRAEMGLDYLVRERK